MDNQGFDLVGSVDMSMGTGENQTDRECVDLSHTLMCSRHLVLRKQGITIDRGERDRDSMYKLDDLNFSVLFLSLAELPLISLEPFRDLVLERELIRLGAAGESSQMQYKLCLVHELPHLLDDPTLSTADFDFSLLNLDLTLTNNLSLPLTLLVEVPTLAFVLVPLSFKIWRWWSRGGKISVKLSGRQQESR